LIEYEGKEVFSDIDSLVDEESRRKLLNKKVARSEPNLSFSIDNKSLQILYSNITSLTVKFYLIDLEILFSRTPFITQVHIHNIRIQMISHLSSLTL
jgi:hypothetical protein